MATELLTVNGYSKRVSKGRARVTRWLDAAKAGDELPGGGIVRADPEGVKWIEVDKEADKPTPAAGADRA